MFHTRIASNVATVNDYTLRENTCMVFMLTYELVTVPTHLPIPYNTTQ